MLLNNEEESADAEHYRVPLKLTFDLSPYKMSSLHHFILLAKITSRELWFYRVAAAFDQ